MFTRICELRCQKTGECSVERHLNIRLNHNLVITDHKH